MAVVGLELFAKAFSKHKDKYVLIGGSACFLNLDELGLNFRVTKDLDIVLIVDVDNLDAEFVRCIWEFIESAGYEIQQKSTGKPIFYRFSNPKDKSFPYMLEFFSRRLETLSLKNESHLTPIPAKEELSSLSAILLDDDYYNLVLGHKKDEKNISYISAECLIPLKAKAYLDLRARKEKGEDIDTKNVKKHKNDVFRIAQLLSEESSVDVPDTVRKDLIEFVGLSDAEPPDLKSLGLKDVSLKNVLDQIRNSYSLG